MKSKYANLLAAGLALVALAGLSPAAVQAMTNPAGHADDRITDARFRSIEIQGIDIACREATGFDRLGAG